MTEFLRSKKKRHDAYVKTLASADKNDMALCVDIRNAAGYSYLDFSHEWTRSYFKEFGWFWDPQVDGGNYTDEDQIIALMFMIEMTKEKH
jgi:hypothetical protein